MQSWSSLLYWRYGVDLQGSLNVVRIFLDGACSDLVDIDALFHRCIGMPETKLKGIRDGVLIYMNFHAVTDRPILPRPYRRRVPKGVVTVLEGARVLARGTRFCT